MGRGDKENAVAGLFLLVSLSFRVRLGSADLHADTQLVIEQARPTYPVF